MAISAKVLLTAFFLFYTSLMCSADIVTDGKHKYVEEIINFTPITISFIDGRSGDTFEIPWGPKVYIKFNTQYKYTGYEENGYENDEQSTCKGNMKFLIKFKTSDTKYIANKISLNENYFEITLFSIQEGTVKYKISLNGIEYNNCIEWIYNGKFCLQNLPLKL